jgi:hypothetical protein
MLVHVNDGFHFRVPLLITIQFVVGVMVIDELRQFGLDDVVVNVELLCQTIDNGLCVLTCQPCVKGQLCDVVA